MPFIWEFCALLVIFGGPAAYGIISQAFKHSERMQEKRNEELRLQIQLERMRNGYSGVQKEPLSPDDLSRDEQVHASYEMGYQQMNQQQ